MSSADPTHTPDEDRLLPMGTFSPRQEAVSYLLRMGLPVPVASALEAAMIGFVKDAVAEHVHGDQHWLQAYGEKLRKIDIREDKEDSGPSSWTVLFTLECSACGKDAIFTAEGPNDEYPEPLCEKCEEGESD